METRTARSWLLGVSLGCCALSARAGDLVETLYAKLAASFASGSGRFDQGAFMILANPGIPLDPAQLKNPHEPGIRRLLNEIPDPSRLFHPSGMKLSTEYGRILDNALATRHHVQADRGRAAAARLKLFDRLKPGRLTQDYADFLQFRAQYEAAEDALTIAVTENKTTHKVPPEELARLTAARNTALAQWNKEGHRAVVEAALADIRKAQDSDIGARILTLRRQLDLAESEGEDPPVSATPPPPEWLAEPGWHLWRYQEKEAPGQDGAPAVPLLLTRARTAAPPTWASSVLITAQLKRVEVDREWLDLSLFQARTWQLNSSCGIVLISSGNLADPNPGLLPLVVTGILLARKLYVTGSWAGGAGPDRELPAGLGPFSLAKAARSAPVAGQSAGSFSLRADAPQIIAFFCTVVPRSPSPDPKLFP